MLAAMQRTIRERSLIAPGDRVLVAVSGGPDSMALLLGLHRLAPRLGIELEAATVNHGLRAESAREATTVVERCAALGVRCEALAVDVRAARGRHVSWQDAARKVRLLALEQAADRRRCQRIALGHSADDQAETILFRIVRGTGVRGLTGIPWRRDRLIRPLLDVRRADILRFLARRHIAFASDPSNVDPRFARARIRNEWLPLLVRENPKLVEALLALAADARRSVSTGADGGERASDLALVPPLSRRAAANVGRLLAEGRGSREVSVAGGVVEISYGKARWKAAASAAGRDMAREVAVTGSGVYRLEPGSDAPALQVRERGPAEGTAGAVGALFDADCLDKLVVRRRRPGDRMRPRGGRGSRKLSDLLVDAKIPRGTRESLPLLATAGGLILFVPGLRPSDEARPDEETRRWLEVCVV
jgi:tRNA(Ile)-lysidine synthase